MLIAFLAVYSRLLSENGSSQVARVLWALSPLGHLSYGGLRLGSSSGRGLSDWPFHSPGEVSPLPSSSASTHTLMTSASVFHSEMPF